MQNQNESQGSGNQEVPQNVITELSGQFAKDNVAAVLGNVMEDYNMRGEVVDLEDLSRVSLDLGYRRGFEAAMNWLQQMRKVGGS